MDDAGHRLTEQRSHVDPPRQWALTVGILLSIAAIAAEGMAIVPALPSAVRELSGLRFFGAVFSSFMLSWLVGTVASGQLADTYGPRVPMSLGLVGFGSGLLCSATAHDMTQLLFGRILQGCGGGCILAAAFVTIARGYSESVRARMIALTSTVWILPAVIGPSLSGWVVEHHSWRFVFSGVLPLVFLVAILVLPPLRALQRRNPWPSSERLFSALRLSCGVGLLLYVINERGHGLAMAGGGITLGLLICIKPLRTLLPAGTLRGRPLLPMGVLARGLLGLAFFGTEAFIPIASGELRGLSPQFSGLALSVAALGWTAASWAIERTKPSPDPTRQAISFVETGFACLLVGIGLVTVTLLSQIPLVGLLVGWTIGGLGMGLGHSAATLLCMTQAPKGQEGAVSSQIQLCEALGMAIGTGLGGAIRTLLLDGGFSARQAMAATFSLPIAMALLGLWVLRRGRNHPSSGSLATAESVHP